MNGDLYTVAKNYQQEQMVQASRERSLRKMVAGRRSSSSSGLRKFIVTVANFMAAFF